MTTGEVVIRVFGISDVGRTREHNEDAFVIADLATAKPAPMPSASSREQTYEPGDRGALFMVADGMGGAAAGEIASSMAVDAVLGEMRMRWVEGPAGGDPVAFVEALRSATQVANERIHGYATDHPENRGMGTTATVAGVLGDTVYIAQVGDSRAYLIRDGQARQITKDQSLMQRLIEAGEITAEEAEVSERRNIILQALGPESYIKIDITHQQLRRGDTLVLCSDGLSGVVRDTEIAEVVRSSADLVTICQRLIARANEAGGPDNITAIAASFEGDGLTAPGADDEVGHRQFPVGESTPVTPVPRVTTGEFSRAASVPVPDAEPRRVPTREIVRPLDPSTSGSPLTLLGALAALVIVIAAVFLYLHRR
jgi:serine/threonine protein phosphatase PrpC